MGVLDRHTWLYVREQATIHMSRMDMNLTVYGPGPAEHSHLFRDIESLEEFLRWYGEALERDGWILQAYVDRRTSLPDDSKPPDGVERRRRSR